MLFKGKSVHGNNDEKICGHNERKKERKKKLIQPSCLIPT